MRGCARRQPSCSGRPVTAAFPGSAVASYRCLTALGRRYKRIQCASSQSERSVLPRKLSQAATRHFDMSKPTPPPPPPPGGPPPPPPPGYDPSQYQQQYGQPGAPPPGYAQPGYAQPGYAQPGYAPPPQDAPAWATQTAAQAPPGYPGAPPPAYMSQTAPPPPSDNPQYQQQQKPAQGAVSDALCCLGGSFALCVCCDICF